MVFNFASLLEERNEMSGYIHLINNENREIAFQIAGYRLLGELALTISTFNNLDNLKHWTKFTTLNLINCVELRHIVYFFLMSPPQISRTTKDNFASSST